MTQIAIERRLTRPLADAAATQTEERNEILHELEQELSEEERFGGQHPVSHGRAYVTYAFVAANLIGFAIEAIAGGTDDTRVLYRLGAVTPPAVVHGEWWRIFLAQFLHFGALHLVLNMLGLIFFGPYLELALGRLRYFAVYLITGSAAMLLVVLTHMGQAADAQPIVVGASGGILGLIGATAGVMLIGWRRHRAQLAKRRLVSMASILVLQAAFDFSMPQVSFTAHISGAIVGLLVTLLIGYRAARRPESRLDEAPAG